MSARCYSGLALGLAVATGGFACSGGESGSGGLSDVSSPTPRAGAAGSVANGGDFPGRGGGGTGSGVPTMGPGRAGNDTGAVGARPLPSGVDPAELIPQRIRRLTNAEFDASAAALTGTSKKLGVNFAPDARQSEYTVNDAQRVDNVTAKQIFAAAQELAAELKTQVATLAPCANTAGSDECAKSFIASFGRRAYRRPLSVEEEASLLALYQVGKTDGTHADGIELVVTGVINSAGFLYLTELGSGPPATPSQGVPLTPYELASALSYLLTAGPPSEQLVADALAGKLDTPEGREAAFWELNPATSSQVTRILLEWVGVDRLAQTDKDSTVYGRFRDLKASMDAEARDFIVGILKGESSPAGGTVEGLLANESTAVAADLKSWYASSVGGVSPPKRRGILNQAAFLSVFAHATESAPVLRGVEVARRVACIPIPSPTSLNIQVVPPRPDNTKTTRERFSIHSTDSACSGCHKTIDSLGFAFEAYDGMGGFRTTDANHPVDSKVTVAVSGDFDGSYGDSNELAVGLSKSAQVRACLARNLFRASAARSDDTVQGSEEAYIRYWQALPPGEQGDILKALLTYVKSPLFTHRRGS